MSLLSCQEVSFAYEGNEVISKLSFQVNEGEYLCIIGENGAGKSTLLKGILNLKKPSAGQILTGDGLKRNEIGYLPQQTQVQKDFPASVYEVVLSGRLNQCGMRPFYNKQDKADAMEKMERLQILPLKNRCYRELSGGQQQRVLLARALCATSKLLFMDEPAAGLDPKVTEEFYRLLWELNQSEHLTIVMVTHDMKAAIDYSSHILYLGENSFCYGTRAEVQERILGGDALWQ